MQYCLYGGRNLEPSTVTLGGEVRRARMRWRRTEERAIHKDETAGWLGMKTKLEGEVKSFKEWKRITATESPRDITTRKS